MRAKFRVKSKTGSAARLTFRNFSFNLQFRFDGQLAIEGNRNLNDAYYLTAAEARQLAAWIRREVTPNAKRSEDATP
jgi:hypothetical protein